MTRRIRVLVLLCRPAVLLLLGLFVAAGLAQGGESDAPLLLARALLVVAGFLVCSVVVNDLADEAIDRVNLPDDAARPLVTGAGARSEFPAIAAAAAAVALAAAATIGWHALATLVGGLALSMAYSLRPVRLAERGAVASLLLPAGYVATPFLVGLFSVRTSVTAKDVALLAGLYVGFIGRILLKDFRDVRGDALFGKRTFLVRYGRRWTCIASGIAWTVGSFALVGVRNPTPALLAAQVAWVVLALVFLRRLAADLGARRDEHVISAIAIVGRGMVLTVIAHLGMTDAGWSVVRINAVTLALLAVLAGQALTMAKHGPASRLRVPSAWATWPAIRGRTRSRVS